MLNACAARFDVMENLVKFWVLRPNKTQDCFLQNLPMSTQCFGALQRLNRPCLVPKKFCKIFQIPVTSNL